jgi:uncharacterized membrane protein YphA (DoxX/SURF4 family)
MGKARSERRRAAARKRRWASYVPAVLILFFGVVLTVQGVEIVQNCVVAPAVLVSRDSYTYGTVDVELPDKEVRRGTLDMSRVTLSVGDPVMVIYDRRDNRAWIGSLWTQLLTGIITLVAGMLVLAGTIFLDLSPARLTWVTGVVLDRIAKRRNRETSSTTRLRQRSAASAGDRATASLLHESVDASLLGAPGPTASRPDEAATEDPGPPVPRTPDR